jgi:hypothetical protein
VDMGKASLFTEYDGYQTFHTLTTSTDESNVGIYSIKLTAVDSAGSILISYINLEILTSLKEEDFDTGDAEAATNADGIPFEGWDL